MPRTRTDMTEAEGFATTADRLWRNPDFQEVFGKIRQRLISDIETAPLDGSVAGAEAALERVRKLQALLSLKSVLAISLKTEELKRTRSK